MPLPTEAQGTLFELRQQQLEAAAVKPEHAQIAAQLPASIRLGAMTWTYPGWKGTVYGERVAEKQLAQHGLTAYAKHPLLRLVELDRTYYQPLTAAELRWFANQVPDDFRFVVKAHQDCCIHRFPLHERYGKRRGEDNPLFLDAGYATAAVIAPLMEGLGHKLGGVLFQFPPQDVGEPGSSRTGSTTSCAGCRRDRCMGWSSGIPSCSPANTARRSRSPGRSTVTTPGRRCRPSSRK